MHRRVVEVRRLHPPFSSAGRGRHRRRWWRWRPERGDQLPSFFKVSGGSESPRTEGPGRVGLSRCFSKHAITHKVYNKQTHTIRGHSSLANQNVRKTYMRITPPKMLSAVHTTSSNARKMSLHCIPRRILPRPGDKIPARSPEPHPLVQIHSIVTYPSPSASSHPFPPLCRRPRSRRTPVTPAPPTSRAGTPSPPSLYSSVWNHQTA
jgi:hypothetical protein